MSRWHSPILVVDFKYNVLRIHRSTLDALGNPDYFEILVSPKKGRIAIRAQKTRTPTAQKVSLQSLTLQRSIELYSTVLTRELLSINPAWENEQIYRMEGALVNSEKLVIFDSLRSELIHSDEYAAAQ